MIVRVADTPFSCHLQTELTHEMISGTNLISVLVRWRFQTAKHGLIGPAFLLEE